MIFSFFSSVFSLFSGLFSAGLRIDFGSAPPRPEVVCSGLLAFSVGLAVTLLNEKDVLLVVVEFVPPKLNPEVAGLDVVVLPKLNPEAGLVSAGLVVPKEKPDVVVEVSGLVAPNENPDEAGLDSAGFEPKENELLLEPPKLKVISKIFSLVLF